MQVFANFARKLEIGLQWIYFYWIFRGIAVLHTVSCLLQCLPEISNDDNQLAQVCVLLLHDCFNILTIIDLVAFIPTWRHPCVWNSMSRAGVAKLQPTGCIQPTSKFIPSCQIPCTFLSSATFSTVDSSATALAVACHINHTVSDPPVARQSRIQPSRKNIWPPLA